MCEIINLENGRVDVGVYNESTGFTLTSKTFIETLDPDNVDFSSQDAKRGDIVPISLDSDSGVNLRVVAGVPMSEQESEEWVGRLVAKLRIPCGTLVLTGGFDDSALDENGDFVTYVKVPAGEYKATIYTYIHSVNGANCLQRAGVSREEIDKMDESVCASEAEPINFLLHLEPIKEPLAEAGGSWLDPQDVRQPASPPKGIFFESEEE